MTYRGRGDDRMSNPSRRLPCAGLAVADVLPAASRSGDLGASYEGRRLCVFFVYRQENISERAPHLLVGAVLCGLCNIGCSEVPAPLEREQACSATCILDTRNRLLPP
jgi:hypothetical protein